MCAVTDEYRRVYLDSTPIIDVRAPQEFARGSMVNSINLPILFDDERADVGRTFKEQGREAAIRLGYKLVQSAVRKERIEGWLKFLEDHPNALITCWRGGLRSQIAQAWLAEHGKEVVRIAGGTKALRNYTLSVLNQAKEHSYVLIGGKTGVGKTEFINQYQESIDLEGLANHRGSAFGSMNSPQPPPIQFEAGLVRELLQRESNTVLMVEDEGKMIGKLGIPEPVFDAMKSSPVVVLKATEQERVLITYNSYVRDTDPQLLLESLGKIQKRMGSKRYSNIKKLMMQAIESRLFVDHAQWIRAVLQHYYDPMYKYQLTNKGARVVFQGNKAEVKHFLTTEYRLKKN